MHRRSVLGRLGATLAGLSVGEVPNLAAAAPAPGEPFSVTHANLAESSGTVTCPMCQEMGDSLELTPAGPCLRCADAHPGLRARPASDPFWTLSPTEVRRLEAEIQRLAAELERIDDRLRMQQQQCGEEAERFDRVMEAERDHWHALQRELHLLHLLRAASRQFRA
jgi:hypothetical protein